MEPKSENELKKIRLDDQEYFRILTSGIEKFDGEKDYLSTESIQRTRINKIECSVTYNERPSRANMQPKINSVWFAKMKSTVKVYIFSKHNKQEINKYILSTGFTGILVNEKLVSPEYLKFFFLSSKFNRMKDSLCSGSTQQAISNNFIKKISLKIPNIKTQRKILSILEKIEKAKELRKKADGLTEDLLKSTFNEMFGKYDFKNSVELGDYCLIKSGKRLPKGKTFSSVKTKYPYIRVTDMINKTVNLDSLKYITEEMFNNIRSYTISSEDVYITIAGTIGKAGTVPEELEGASLTENAAKIMIKDVKKLNKVFLCYLVSCDYLQDQIKNKTGTVGVPKLALFRIKTLKILTPPIHLQNKFASIVKDIESMKEHQKHSKKQIDDLFDSLMQRAFKGEIS